MMPALRPSNRAALISAAIATAILGRPAFMLASDLANRPTDHLSNGLGEGLAAIGILMAVITVLAAAIVGRYFGAELFNRQDPPSLLRSAHAGGTLLALTLAFALFGTDIALNVITFITNGEGLATVFTGSGGWLTKFIIPLAIPAYIFGALFGTAVYGLRRLLRKTRGETAVL